MKHAYVVAAPLDAVLACHRDDLSTFGASLPAVDRVEPVQRDEHADHTVLVHQWHGDPGFLPGPIARHVPSESFLWTDRTTWSGTEARWAITAPALGEGPHLKGSFRFHGEGAFTRVEVDAELAFVGALTLFGVPFGRLLEPVATAFMRQLFGLVVGHAGRAVEAHLGRHDAGPTLRRPTTVAQVHQPSP